MQVSTCIVRLSRAGSSDAEGILPRALSSLFSAVEGKLYPGRDLKPQYYCSLLSLDERETKLEEERKEKLFRETHDLSHSTLVRSWCTKLIYYITCVIYKCDIGRDPE